MTKDHFTDTLIMMVS